MPPPSLDATDYPTLFSPGRIGSLTLRNRIVQLPMGTSLIEHAQVTDREVATTGRLPPR